MDPNEALRLIRAYIAQLRTEAEHVLFAPGTTSSNFKQHTLDLAETFDGLDEWLSKDGFLPSDWQQDDHEVVEKKVAIVNALLDWSALRTLLPWGQDEDINGGDLVQQVGNLLHDAGLIEEPPEPEYRAKPGYSCMSGTSYGYPSGYTVHRRFGGPGDCDEFPDGTITDNRYKVVGNLHDR